MIYKALEAFSRIEDCFYEDPYADRKDVSYESDVATVKKELKALKIIKPLCEVYETPKGTYRYLKVNGVVVYRIKSQEEFDLLKEVVENEKA